MTRPKIVCLCGSTRFSSEYQLANLSETISGRIVLTIGADMKSDAELFDHLTTAELEVLKGNLDALHKRKIDLADAILVINPNGYIGMSTAHEIAYAEQLGKEVWYWNGSKEGLVSWTRLVGDLRETIHTGPDLSIRELDRDMPVGPIWPVGNPTEGQNEQMVIKHIELAKNKLVGLIPDDMVLSRFLASAHEGFGAEVIGDSKSMDELVVAAYEVGFDIQIHGAMVVNHHDPKKYHYNIWVGVGDQIP